MNQCKKYLPLFVFFCVAANMYKPLHATQVFESSQITNSTEVNSLVASASAPKVEKYPSYDTYVSMIPQFQTSYPELCKVTEIGQSVKGKKIFSVKITSNINERGVKPLVLGTGGVHGDEVLGFMFAMKLIDVLLSEYKTNAKVAKLVDSLEIYIIPMVNPDGVYASGNNSCMGGTRANSAGVDLNRNYPDIVGGNKSPAKENKISIEFDTSHNFTFCLDFHSGGEAVGYPYASRKKQAPDSLWYEQEGKRHAAAVQAQSSNYFKDFGGKGYGNAYLMLPDVQGTRVDYLAFYCHCLSYGFELSKNKQIQESQWLTYWGYHRESVLDDYTSVLYGMRGIVTDSKTGKGLKAKIFVNDQKNDSTHVYTNLPHGDFWRPIYKGTYSLTFTCSGYKDKKVEKISVQDKTASVVNVQLEPTNTDILSEVLAGKQAFSIAQTKSGITISVNGSDFLRQVSIYDLSGKEIWSKHFTTTSEKSMHWNGFTTRGQSLKSGCYVIKVKTLNKSFVSQNTYLW